MEEDPFLILHYDSEMLTKFVRRYPADVGSFHDARNCRYEQAESLRSTTLNSPSLPGSCLSHPSYHPIIRRF